MAAGPKLFTVTQVTQETSSGPDSPHSSHTQQGLYGLPHIKEKGHTNLTEFLLLFAEL